MIDIQVNVKMNRIKGGEIKMVNEKKCIEYLRKVDWDWVHAIEKQNENNESREIPDKYQ